MTYQRGGAAPGSATTRVVKAADETVNNSATVQPDGELSFAVGANESWIFKFFLVVTSGASGATTDFRSAVVGPAGSTVVAVSDGAGTGATTNTATNRAIRAGASGTELLAGCLDNGTVMVAVEGSVVTGETAGTVALHWAQSTAGASDTTVKAGSHLVAQKA